MISTRGRYALRVMIDLAQQGTNHYTPLKEVAERQRISKKYIEAIMGRDIDRIRGFTGITPILFSSILEFSYGENDKII